MQSTRQSEFKKTQAIKLFHLIQQISTDSINHITSRELQHITSIWKEGHSFNPIIFDSFNPKRKELTEDNFGLFISQFLKDYVSSCQDLVAFNRDMRAVFLGEYTPKDPLHDLLCQQFAITHYDSSSEKQYKDQVAAFHMEIRYSLAISFDSQVVKKINYAMATIFHSYEWFQTLCQDALCDFLKTGFLDKLIQQLEAGNFLDDYYKCLVFMTQASKFQRISKYLTSSLFFSHKAWNLYLRNYFDISNVKGNQIGTARSHVFAFISNYISVCPEFGDFLIAWISTSPNDATIVLMPPNLNPQQTFSAKYSLYIFTQLIKKSAENEIVDKPTLVGTNIRDMQAFAMKILTNGAGQTVNPSIELLAETSRFNINNTYNERNVGFTLKALETNPPQYSLIRAVLLVFENALKCNNEDVVWIFAKNSKCMNFIKAQLLQVFEGGNNIHCQCLQILYHLAQPKYILSFKEHDILAILLQAAKNSDLLLTIISKIIFRVVEVTCDNKMWNLMSAKDTILLLTYLIEFVGTKKDVVMNYFLNDVEFPYLNKQIFFNVMKSLYILSNENLKSDKHFFLDDLEGLYSHAIIKQLTNLVIWLKDSQFGKKFLREKAEFKDEETLKVYKLIFVIGEQLLRAHRNKDKVQRQAIFTSRNHLQAALYSVLELRELQIQNIPIFIEYEFRYESRFNNNFIRHFMSTISFTALKTFVLEIFNERIIKQNQQPATNIYFIDQIYGHQEKIKNDQDFKGLLRKCLSKKENQYRIALRIIIEQSGIEEPSLNNPLTRFNNQANERTLRVSPHSHSHRIEQSIHLLSQRGRSKSPFRQTSSAYMSERIPNGPTPSIHMCQNCRVMPSPNGRLCYECNKL